MRGLILLVCLLAPAIARADSVNMELFTKVAQGQVPKVRLRAAEDVQAVSLALTRDDGKKYGLKTGRLATGAMKELGLGGEPGRHKYTGTLAVTVGGEHTDTPVEFDAIVAAPLQIVVDKAKVDIAGRKLEVKLSRPPGKIAIKVLSETGAVIAEDESTYSGDKAGAPLIVTWRPDKGHEQDNVAKIELRCYDEDDFFSGLVLMPWSLYIPHEEVNFKTDSSAVEDSERPKLEASHTKITDALARYKDIGQVKLYIAGHTDTQGGDGYNLKLSRERAQAIGSWFRKRGLRIPISYEGFGESALLVPTADNVDEPRNRRVDYILSVEEPQLRTKGFGAAWKRVP